MTAAEILDDDLAQPVEWREFALCKGQMNLFFARKAERPQARARREAKALRLCTVCVVQAQCQQAARENHEYGFWGGESEEDRHLAGYTVSAPIGVRARLAEQERATVREIEQDRHVS